MSSVTIEKAPPNECHCNSIEWGTVWLPRIDSNQNPVRHTVLAIAWDCIAWQAGDGCAFNAGYRRQNRAFRGDSSHHDVDGIGRSQLYSNDETLLRSFPLTNIRKLVFLPALSLWAYFLILSPILNWTPYINWDYIIHQYEHHWRNNRRGGDWDARPHSRRRARGAKGVYTLNCCIDANRTCH